MTEYCGPFGTATHLQVNPDLPGADTTVCWWLLSGLRWHPLWNQFALVVVHLRPTHGTPPPRLHFPGATHELLVMALNPERGPRTPTDLAANGLGPNAWLTPLDVVHQFEATDTEMQTLAGMLAEACVQGWLTPSTDDARQALREMWLTVCVKTLAHGRGEEHAP